MRGDAGDLPCCSSQQQRSQKMFPVAPQLYPHRHRLVEHCFCLSLTQAVGPDHDFRVGVAIQKYRPKGLASL